MKVTSLLQQEAEIGHKTLQFLSDYYNMNTLTLYVFMYISPRLPFLSIHPYVHSSILLSNVVILNLKFFKVPLKA